MKIRCMAIDDEPYALQQLCSYIEKVPFLELAGACSNAFEAMDLMSAGNIDLIFIDINLPEMSGMDFVKTLPPGSAVIFTTAYSQYAVESYKVNAIDYLLKPTTFEDFFRAAGKAQKYFLQNSPKETVKTPGDHIFVNAYGKLVRVNFAEIDFVESMSEYVKIHLVNNNRVITLMRLKNLEENLPENFMRVHRSFIVNTEHITTIERNRIVFYGNVYVPVSEQYRNEFREFIDKHFCYKRIMQQNER